MNAFLPFIMLIAIFLSNPCLANDDCFPSNMGNRANNFPDSIHPNSIFKATGLDHNICGISMAKWPYSKASYIVYAEDTLNYYIFLIKKVNQTFQIAAKYKSQLGEYRFKSFDFAPYKIRKNSTALGIRFFESGPLKGGIWECINLFLFEITGNKLRLVLSTLVESFAEGNDVAYDMDTHFEEHASSIIIIGKIDETGYNRIIKKSKYNKMTFYWDNSGYSPENGGVGCGDTTIHCFCSE